jgi:hypothetical protein
MSRQVLANTSKQETAVPGHAEIRSALRAYLKEAWVESPETHFVEELGLCQGRVRIDLAVVNGVLHGYEIKSDRDRLDRLPSQMDSYGRVLDRVSIVAGPRHLDDVLRMLPAWWGVLRAAPAGDDVRIDSVRPPRENPAQTPRALAELLWRDEALALLETRNAADGVRSKPRPAIWNRVCEIFDVGEIAEAVRDRIRSRAASSAPQ